MGNYYCFPKQQPINQFSYDQDLVSPRYNNSLDYLDDLIELVPLHINPEKIEILDKTSLT